MIKQINLHLVQLYKYESSVYVHVCICAGACNSYQVWIITNPTNVYCLLRCDVSIHTFITQKNLKHAFP